jgi:elongator complex protein 1
MKNLILLSENRHCVSSIGDQQGDFVISTLLPNPNADHDDPDFADPSEAFHYILSPTGNLSGISSNDAIIWSLNLNEFVNDEDKDKAENEHQEHEWFHLSHEENSDLLIALSRNGAIISVTPDGKQTDLIGCFDHGIHCAAWSSDAELLALVTYQEHEGEIQDTANGNDVPKELMVPVLMTMNTQFEILSEVPLPHHIPDQPISVCWNKKTDNQLVAISTHDSEDDKRKIRIFQGESLESIANSRTEDGSGKLIPNILAVPDIAWAGSNSSNLLACVQRKGRKGRNIVFLEQNGLQHGGFKLEHRLDHEEVVGLDWNSDSDLLAITLLGKGQDAEYGKVQFYHRNNYHWYLKYEIQLKDGLKVSCVLFDEIKSYNVSIALQNTIETEGSVREWRQYRFIWDTSTTSQNGTAAVVDGNNLNLTMFQQAMIPPPMYASRLVFDKAIVGVSHIPSNLHETGIDLLVQLSDGTLAFCDSSKATFDGGAAKEISTKAILDLSYALDTNGSPLETMDSSCLRQFQVVDVKHDGDDIHLKVLSVACCKANNSEGPKKVEELVAFIVKISSIDGGNTASCTVVNRNRIVLEGKVLRMVKWLDSEDANGESGSQARGKALIELIDGSLFQYSYSLESDSDDEVMPCEAEPMLLEPCPWLQGILTAGGRQLVIGQSSRFRLYFGERQLCDASSSFMLSPSHEFLGYVTLGSRSQLRFLPLKVLLDFDPLMGSEENLEFFAEGYEPRNVERGSTLVSILPHKPSVVLQLPRGNIEGVYPRALVLPHIMSLIDEDQYQLALDLMRRQKVDMNLIVDMNPMKCLEGGGLRKMVGQVKNIDHLNLFLASLQNHDITQWQYRVPAWLRSRAKEQNNQEISQDGTRADTQSPFDFTTKVNKICSKMRLEMMDMEYTGLSPKGQFLLPILSTFAKENPPKLHDALQLIKEMAISTASTIKLSKKKSILLSDHAQSSIKYLAFLADYELLFDTALGMYDFELAKAVARNSQMDPKIYLPMLKRLRSLPDYEAKFEVDVKLKRFESALTHLYKIGVPEFDSESKLEFSEEHFIKCLKFIEEHKLHQLGLNLFVAYPIWHNQIMISLGESLLRQSNADLALSVFLAANPPSLKGARKAARMCGDYKTFFSCFDSDELSADEKLEIASDVAQEVADGIGGLLSQRDGYAAAARILLDYCEDIEGAVDMLITAQMWFEGRRLARLHGETEIEQQIIDAAVSYGKTCLSDFETRAENFLDANKRYAEVLIIRRKAKFDGEAAGGDENDETASLFSLASNASNTSMRSNMSASSVGSVTSVSSVISAGAASTFSLINNGDSIRHKSKFNNIGRKKKKKKTRRERLGKKPGSEEELQSLVTKVKSSAIDPEHSAIISETIRFLCQVGKVSFALQIYNGYEELKQFIEKYQTERIEKDSQAVKDEEQRARREGQFHEKVVLDCEEEVNNARCADLPQVIHNLLAYKIGT